MKQKGQKKEKKEKKKRASMHGRRLALSRAKALTVQEKRYGKHRKEKRKKKKSASYQHF